MYKPKGPMIVWGQWNYVKSINFMFLFSLSFTINIFNFSTEKLYVERQVDIDIAISYNNKENRGYWLEDGS